ncbi:developmental protein FluG [Metarhizium album ARSEF 1941]|uniref:Glutamine synthetase n=1 Tax=Metarhizium album (strain ARSEF 1941) TaxID=1081103 RepID=A0A0B2X4N5_METAS|nr:developmental protein FluG [Metarhizium album ARSEF 1941]KHO00415.1 developmental protein FluG [Metarhizium album ARSEF 1941]
MDGGFHVGAEALRRCIQSTPIIDNHAHPLLQHSHADKYPLLTIVTEAHGDALDSSRTSLAHIRAVKQLSEQLGCAATWDAVESAIKQERRRDYAGWTRRCLAGIECVLVDDGLDDEDAVESYTYFDQFAPSPSKRIVRIEQAAARLIENACISQPSPAQAFDLAIANFEAELRNAISDAEVVGFKSVICYRTGLDIASKASELEARSTFADIYTQRQAADAQSFTRLHHRALNEFLVHRLAQLIRDCSSTHKKPIQFHTGLGDNDLTLTRSSPAHLQDFAREYPTVPIILLHSGYPFDREAGYMAAMYGNVYADIGEIFPFINRDGQESVVRHVLELCPWEKIIWSTDGHWFPETYLLSILQMRDVFHTVLCDFVRKGDITWKQATQMVQDMLFNTSNKIYDLGLTMRCRLPKNAQPSGTLPTKFEAQHLLTYLADTEKPHYLRLCWLDYTAMPRMRVIPSRQVLSAMKTNQPLWVTVTKGCLGILQNDTLIPGVGPVGEFQLQPDFSSLRPGPRDGHITVMCDFKEKDGSLVNLCPRTMLKRAIDLARDEHIELLLGFEIELVLLRRPGNGGYSVDSYDGHACSTVGAMDHEVVEKVLEAAIQQLDHAGVYVEMLHAESATGQFEIVLPKARPMEAVDTLIFARQVIASCANASGYKMTLHPKPIANACGTAAHAHISITSDGRNAALYEPFYAGILSHLRAICAFTCSNMVSYERLRNGVWAGGTWVTWGTQNREAPLRKIENSHWELKCVDGLSNPYMAMAAIVLAGLDGVRKGKKLTWADCTRDPASLSSGQRLQLGIDTRLPESIDEALKALVEDGDLTNLLEVDVIKRYVAVKEAEAELMKSMDAKDRRDWILDRY